MPRATPGRGLNPGDKYGKLTVLRFVGYRKCSNQSHGVYECECECGRRRVFRGGNVKDGSAASCGCVRRKSGAINGNRYHTALRSGAKHRGIDFDLTVEYLDGLFVSQGARCNLSGVGIKLGARDEEATASLDRIDSSIGYVEGNVQWVHKDINRMKQAFGQDYFIDMCRKVVEHNDRLNQARDRGGSDKPDGPSESAFVDS